jgi:methyl-accepting chemotaxis protein
MSRSTLAAIATVILALAAAVLAHQVGLARALSVAAVLAGAVATALALADRRAATLATAAETTRVAQAHAMERAAWEQARAELERSLQATRSDLLEHRKTVASLADAVALLTETAAIVDKLSKTAIEKSEQGSTTLADDVYQIGRRSASLGESIAGFLTELSTGDDSLELSLGEMEAGVERLSESAAIYDKTNASLDASVERISRSVECTSDLIVQVSEIAERTGILAINAAIYAAKAGSFGKGFSVIAGEIQKLAGTAKEVAESIGSNTVMIENLVTEFGARHRELMTDSQKNLTQTIQSIRHTIAGLQPRVGRIRSSIREASDVSSSVTGHLSDINMAIQQQDAIQQIVRHMAEIFGDALTRASSSPGGELATATEEVASLARAIAVGHFTMEEEYIAIGDASYRSHRSASVMLADGSKLSGNVTLY